MNVEKLAGSKVKFEVIIPVDTFKKALDVAFEKKVKEVEVKGFRKGTCPRNVFEAKFGVESLYDEALNEAINETYYEAVVENKIDVCGYPKIDLDVNKVNQTEPIHYFVTVSVYPVVELGEYKGLEIEKDKVTVSVKEVNTEIDKTLENESMLVKKEGENVVIENGDTVVFDFEGLKDGVAFPGGTAKDYSLVIGSGQFIPGFEDQMVGMAEGEHKDLNVTFPEDYQEESLKGQPVVFKVDVKEIKTKNVPALDDDFVKELKLEGVETVDDYKKHVKAEIKDRKDKAAHDKALNELYKKVIENAKFELAEDLIQEEADYNYKGAENQAKQYGLDLATLLMYTGQGSVEDFKKNCFEQAKQSLSLKFVLKAIAEKEAFAVSDDEKAQKYQEIADQYKMSIDDVKAQLPESAVVEEITSKMAYEFVEKEAKFVQPKKASTKEE